MHNACDLRLFLSNWYVRVESTQNVLKRFLTKYLKILPTFSPQTVKERNSQRGVLAPSTGEDANILKDVALKITVMLATSS